MCASFHAQISSHDPLERVHELLVGGRVAEGIDGAVEIADKVGEHVDVNVDAGRAEAGDDGQDVVRRPASHEGPQDDADCFQGLPGPVLGFLLGLLSSPELEPLPDGEFLPHSSTEPTPFIRGEGGDVIAAIKDLPEETRQIFFLHFDEGLH